MRWVFVAGLLFVTSQVLAQDMTLTGVGTGGTPGSYPVNENYITYQTGDCISYQTGDCITYE